LARCDTAGTADLEEEIRGTAAMMAAFAGHGLTGVVDGGGMTTAPRDYDALYELWRREGLTVQVGAPAARNLAR
jgi:hypothetical protein